MAEQSQLEDHEIPPIGCFFPRVEGSTSVGGRSSEIALAIEAKRRRHQEEAKIIDRPPHTPHTVRD